MAHAAPPAAQRAAPTPSHTSTVTHQHTPSVRRVAPSRDGCGCRQGGAVPSLREQHQHALELGSAF
eukprot:gene7809-32475_t